MTFIYLVIIHRIIYHYNIQYYYYYTIYHGVVLSKGSPVAYFSL